MAGLYIHIPLCASKCNYCDFYSVGGLGRLGQFGRNAGGGTDPLRGCDDLRTRLVAALKREISARRGVVAGFSTIYVGGGTPSLLSPAELQGLLDHATNFEFRGNSSAPPRGVGGAEINTVVAPTEITLEANPEDLTDEYLEQLAKTDFNRLSIGVQSFDDDLLRLMNRRHNAQRAREAVRRAQKIGGGIGDGRGAFGRNISIDLIYGIPGMTMAQWERTLDEAIDLGVRHISAYHLTIEPGTPFGRWAETSARDKSPSAFRPITETESERQYELLRRKLAAADFEQYEISNFARSGFRAVHNSAYWSGQPYLGVGPSAHSYDGARTRSWVKPDLEKYLETFGGEYPEVISDGGFSALYESETLTDTDLYNEWLMVGLRRTEGVPRELVRGDVRKLLHDGLIMLNRDSEKDGEEGGAKDSEKDGAKGDRLVIPPEKFLLADYIISSLFE